MVGTHEGKKVFQRSKIDQIIVIVLTCVPISKLPSNESTMLFSTLDTTQIASYSDTML